MLTEDGKHLYVSQDEYLSLVERLAVKIHQSNWEFDIVLCLARGGLRVGDILARVFDKPLAIMSTSSYHGEGGTVQGSLAISRYIATPHGDLEGKVLMVDDLSDTGVTLQEVAKELRIRYTKITDVKTAVIWVKERSVFTPDYCMETLIGNPWIHQPFELYETTRPADLVKKWQNCERIL